MSVYQKLQKARVELQNKNLKKSGWNKYSEYAYYEMGDFLPTINELFLEAGLCGVVTFTNDFANLRIHDTEDKTQVDFTSPLGSAKLKACHEVQNIGAVESYQRRYLYLCALEISEADPLDAVTGAEKPTKSKLANVETKKGPAPNPEVWVKNFINAMAKLKPELKEMTGGDDKYYEALGTYGVTHSNEMKGQGREKALELYGKIEDRLNELKKKAVPDE